MNEDDCMHAVRVRLGENLAYRVAALRQGLNVLRAATGSDRTACFPLALSEVKGQAASEFVSLISADSTVLLALISYVCCRSAAGAAW